MGLVTRPTKTGGNTTYVAEVAGGNTIIKAAEVDADLNAIITGGVNNIETANINATGLGTAALANLAVTNGKLAVGAGITAIQTGGVAASQTSGGGTVETTFVTMASITTRGGRIFLGGSWSLTYGVTNLRRVTIRVKRGATTIYTVEHTYNDIAGSGVTFQVPAPLVTEVPAAGSYIYTVTAQSDGAATLITAASPVQGSFFVVEFA